MTEAEWLASTDPMMMLYEFMADSLSPRKLRLFAVACCRRVWHLLGDERSRSGVEISERFVDSLASEAELQVCHVAAWDAYLKATGEVDWTTYSANANKAAAASAAAAAHHATSPKMNWDAAETVARDAAYGVSEDFEKAAQANLLRCIFGSLPFRPVTVNTSWLLWNDGTVRKIAQAIDDDRAFDHLPILADALEDAGCNNADILAHCRGPGPHVRGCWVVDLLLGKE